MFGLAEVDITTASRLLAGHHPPSSLTAFVVASVARAAAAHPEVHAYRNWRGPLVTHHHVDVATTVEISTPEGPFALPHVLRDADVREVPDLTAELRRVQRDPSASPKRQMAGPGRSGRDQDSGHGPGQVALRDVLDLTVAIDHNVVDGAPAARFGAGFRELLESAAVLSPPD